MNKIFLILFFMSLSIQAKEKSICGRSDDRDFSNDPKIGRVNDGEVSVCTVTMIGPSCALTAGHCHQILYEVSFNVPNSREGRLVASRPEDRYIVDRYETYYANNGPGDDYAVLKLLPNKLTGKFAGETQGFYEVSFDRPRADHLIGITGYGKDARPTRNHSQQEHAANILRLERSTIQHDIDTRFGNSGSVIIDQISQKIIGIHTHGACYSSGGSNYGTLISGHTRLSQAIRNCLLHEDELTY